MNSFGKGFREILKNRNIVRGEAPKHVFFSTHLPKIKAIAVDILELAYFPLIDKFFDFPYGWMKQE